MITTEACILYLLPNNLMTSMWAKGKYEKQIYR